MDTPPSTYNLQEELKKLLFVSKKERIHACGNQTGFQFVFSCFHNYEVSCAVVIMIVYLSVSLTIVHVVICDTYRYIEVSRYFAI